MSAAVLIEILGAGEPLKSFWRSASVARGFNGDAPSVGLAASTTIHPTAIRRQLAPCAPNEPDLIRCARVVGLLAVHIGLRSGSGAERVPHTLRENPREMTPCASSVWCGPDVCLRCPRGSQDLPPAQVAAAHEMKNRIRRRSRTPLFAVNTRGPTVALTLPVKQRPHREQGARAHANPVGHGRYLLPGHGEV
jgi:hypothetical protein